MSNDEIAKVIPLFKEDPNTEALQELLVTWEALYMQHGQTLTDHATADSLRVAMEMMRITLEGACAAEVITEAQRDQLLGIVRSGQFAADEFQR